LQDVDIEIELPTSKEIDMAYNVYKDAFPGFIPKEFFQIIFKKDPESFIVVKRKNKVIGFGLGTINFRRMLLLFIKKKFSEFL